MLSYSYMLMLLIEKRLEKLVRRYFAAHPEIRLVAITGSVGKASTKQAVGTVLATSFRVRMHDEIDQSPAAVSLAILGIDRPKNNSLFAWLRTIRAAKYQVRHPQEIDVIVQELPTRNSGTMLKYGSYIRPDVTVITAVSAVHMENFANVDIFGAELFEATKFSDVVLVNRDDVDSRYAEFDATPNIYTYGTSGMSEYHVEYLDADLLRGTEIQIETPAWTEMKGRVALIGEHSLRPVAAAVGVASVFGMSAENIAAALPRLKPLYGRMNPLRGIDGTIILDDTMSASPADMMSALQALYKFDTAPQRIAILGSMDYLAGGSDQMHEAVGRICNADLLAWVIVVGEPAANHIAPAARLRGCQVKIAKDAIEAAEFARSVAEPGAVILVKGSADYYLEETVHTLANISEQHKIVRQSQAERDHKDKAFSRYKS